MKCKICGRKIIVVQRNYKSIHQLYFKHGEYIMQPEARGDFDNHKPESEMQSQEVSDAI
jgi:hypothetical protein